MGRFLTKRLIYLFGGGGRFNSRMCGLTTVSSIANADPTTHSNMDFAAIRSTQQAIQTPWHHSDINHLSTVPTGDNDGRKR
jgi:hypothetical protein